MCPTGLYERIKQNCGTLPLKRFYMAAWKERKEVVKIIWEFLTKCPFPRFYCTPGNFPQDIEDDECFWTMQRCSFSLSLSTNMNPVSFESRLWWKQQAHWSLPDSKVGWETWLFCLWSKKVKMQSSLNIDLFEQKWVRSGDFDLGSWEVGRRGDDSFLGELRL